MKARTVPALTLCCLLALVGLAPAEDVSVPANKFVRLSAELTSPNDLVFWSVDKEDAVDAEELPGGKLLFCGPSGVYRVKCVVVPVKDGKIAGPQVTKRFVVTIGQPGPSPGPGPQPPTPPGPAPPVPDPGMRVLILEETAERTKLPEAQQAAIFSVTVRQYLDQKCVPSPSGKTHEWGIFDKDADLSGYSPQLQAMRQKAMADPSFKTPWLVVGDGKTGFSGPLPADTASLMNQLKQFGEKK